MKTITCDKCNETVGPEQATHWSSLNIATHTISAVTMQAMYTNNKLLDLCASCTLSMMEWVEMEILSRPGQDDE